MEESPQIEDIVSSAPIARGAKLLNVSLGASYLFDFSALSLAGTSVSAAPWGLGAAESFWAFSPWAGQKGHFCRHPWGALLTSFEAEI
ncbi:hypothetical protein PoB_002146900 [Plakobranchus ocellatus]|uniref:Uncharacterized protein n=1 Tax=Plakobranchus ocellatus TaxID=259542 RepID=A0AAV3ZI21_9GAST|nr:hypothetical protein PoB_002146900 [Plakobranchus ocellatus]